MLPIGGLHYKWAIAAAHRPPARRPATGIVVEPEQISDKAVSVQTAQAPCPALWVRPPTELHARDADGRRLPCAALRIVGRHAWHNRHDSRCARFSARASSG